MDLPGTRHGVHQLRGVRPAPLASKFFLLLSAVYIVAAMQDIVSFTIWPSVAEFLGDLESYRYFEKDWQEILLSPWGIRTGIAIPAIMLAESTPLTQEQSFGLFCGVCLTLTSFLISRTLVTCLRMPLSQHELLVASVIFGLGYFMNGRLCPAFVGSALIMRAHVYWIADRMATRRVLIYNSIALPLMTVSSGTFLVGLMTVMLWLMFAMLDWRCKQQTRFRFGVLVGMLPVLYLALVQASLFTTKLYEYYEGNMIQVLFHGYGEIIEDYLPELTVGDAIALLVAASPGAAFAVMCIVRPLSWMHRYLFFSVALTLCLGACGYSTMFTNTPSMVLAFVLFLRGRRTILQPAARSLRVAA